jgi:hypothetical protein
MCSSSAPASHVGDTPSTSDVKVGKKKTSIKFPCMLCKRDHYSNLFPRMDEASSLLEKLQLPTGYRKIIPNPSLVDGMVNSDPSPVILVDHVVTVSIASSYFGPCHVSVVVPQCSREVSASESAITNIMFQISVSIHDSAMFPMLCI